MTMTVTMCATEDEACVRARRVLGASLAECTAAGPTLLLASGGSSLALLDTVPDDVVWHNLTVGLIDERFGTDAVHRNDAAVAASPLAGAVRVGGGTLLPFPHDAADVLDAARLYDDAVRAWINRYPDGCVIATLGIGQDGHTAGIMPYPEDSDFFAAMFDDADRWYAGYDATGRTPLPLRVTATLPLLRDVVDRAVVFAAGPDKVSAVASVMDDGPLPTCVVPARIVRLLRDARIFASR